MPPKKSTTKTPGASASTPTKTPYATIVLVHGAGEMSIQLDSERMVESFKMNVTKRDLRAFPWEFQDMHGTSYILREFLFCRIVLH
tara:strand:+ start:168 stop:425 length:258 start_codon:yes stop_codon:yes gene_type:complete